MALTRSICKWHWLWPDLSNRLVDLAKTSMQPQCQHKRNVRPLKICSRNSDLKRRLLEVSLEDLLNGLFVSSLTNISKRNWSSNFHVTMRIFTLYLFYFVDYNPNAWLGLSKNSRKLKWAKRFTALTKRTAAIEMKKVNARAQVVLREFGVELPCGDSTNSCASFEITSKYLSKFYMHDNMLFRLHGAVNEAGVEEFYTNNLLEVSTVKCGCLLKDWRAIPGRDATPEREHLELSNPTHSKVSHSNEKCDENEKEDSKNIRSDEKIDKNEQDEDKKCIDDMISISASPADVFSLNPKANAVHVENITSKKVSQNRLLRGGSPDIFDDSDDEELLSKTVLAPESPPQSIQSNASIEIATSCETSNTSIPEAFDSIAMPSSCETLTSTQLDDDISDISEELPPPSQFRTRQDEEEERLLELYTKGRVDATVNAEVEPFSEPPSPMNPVPSTISALQVSVMGNSADLPMDFDDNMPEEAISLSGSFAKQTQTGVAVFEEFCSDDGEISNDSLSKWLIDSVLEKTAVPITRAPSSTPHTHKLTSDIIEISDDSSTGSFVLYPL